jgi:hypothetical protein
VPSTTTTCSSPRSTTTGTSHPEGIPYSETWKEDDHSVAMWLYPATQKVGCLAQPCVSANLLAPPEGFRVGHLK